MFEDEDEFDVVLPKSIDNDEDAKAVIAGIRSIADELKGLAPEHEKVKKAVDDLNAAMQVLQASSFDRGGSEPVGSSEKELFSRYVSEDGDLRLLGSEREFSFAGQTFKDFEPGILDDRENVCQWQYDLKKALSLRNTARLAMKKDASTPHLDAQIARLLARAPQAGGFRKAVEEHCKRSFDPKKKAFTNTSAVGAEWIPETFIPDLYEAMQVRGDIRGAFQEINITSDSFKRPRVSNVTRPYLLSQITNDNPAAFTASTPTTGEESYTVPGLAVRTLVDVAASEDSAIAAAARIGRLLLDSLLDGERDTALNGDTTATHEDAIETWNIRSRWGSSGLGGAADHRRGFKGLRRQAVDRSTTLDMASLQTTAGLLQLIALLGERAASQLRIFCSPEVFIQKLMGLSEVLTIDKFGPKATIVSGQLADIFGIPIVPTRFMGADLATTGLYTGTGAKSGVIVADVSAYYWVARRAEMVEMEKKIATQHVEIVATNRRGFDTPDDSSAKNVAFGYGWL